MIFDILKSFISVISIRTAHVKVSAGGHVSVNAAVAGEVTYLHLSPWKKKKIRLFNM